MSGEDDEDAAELYPDRVCPFAAAVVIADADVAGAVIVVAGPILVVAVVAPGLIRFWF